jgi:hypothetical protein
MKYSEPSSVSVRHWCDNIEGQPSRMIERVGRDEASAIEAWNRRAQVEAPAEPVAHGDRIITYTHCTGGDRFRQRLCDPLPSWAYDVREETPLPSAPES